MSNPPTIIILPIDPGSPPQVRANDVGIVVQMNADDLQNLSNYTSVECTIVGPTGNRHQVACTVSVDGSTASFTTGATDFPQPGSYTLQLVAIDTAPTLNIVGPELTLVVGARL